MRQSQERAIKRAHVMRGTAVCRWCIPWCPYAAAWARALRAAAVR